MASGSITGSRSISSLITNPKVYSNGEYQTIIGKLNISNPKVEDLTMKPSENIKVMNIFTDKDGYRIFIENFINSPVLPIQVNIFNLEGEIICRFPPSRTSNRPGTVPYRGSCNLFSAMKLTPSFGDEDYNYIFISSLYGYRQVLKENRPRLFKADIEKFIGTSTKDPDYEKYINDKCKPFHIITSNVFENVPLENFFGSVIKEEIYSKEIERFVQHFFGRIISSHSNQFSKMINFNEDADFSITNTTNKKVQVCIRTRGRLHITTDLTGDTNCSIIIIGKNITQVEGCEINIPLIVSDDKKKVLKDVTNIVRITTNLPKEHSIMRSLMDTDIFFRELVFNYACGITIIPEEQFDEEFTILVSIMERFYNIFTSKLSHIDSRSIKEYEGDTFGRNVGAMMSSAPIMVKRQMSYI